MNTYNYYLFNKRSFLGLSRKKMGKALGMGGFRYRLIENGYLKPKRKEITRFSAFFGEDFTPYLEGPASNPSDLPKAKEYRIATWAYELIGKLWVRILLAFVTVLSLGVFTSTFFVSDYYDNHVLSLYPEQYQTLVHDIQANGSRRISLLGDFVTREIVHNYVDEDNYPVQTYIYRNGNSEGSSSLDYGQVRRGKDYRIVYNTPDLITNEETGEDGLNISATITFFDPDFRLPVNFNYYSKDNYQETLEAAKAILDGKPDPILSGLPKEPVQAAVDHLPDYVEDLNVLLADETLTTSGMTLVEALKQEKVGDDASMGLTIYAVAGYIGGLLLAGVFAFAFLFSMFYGRKKGAPMPFTRSYVAVIDPPEQGKKPLKKDIRFTPFIPETVLELVGIALVFFGSLRSIGYVAGFFGLSTVTLGDYMNNGTVLEFMGMFMIGMFLLYIVDFDTYMEDYRVVRCIFQYAIIFICLYDLEVLLMNSLESATVLGSLTQRIPIPNMFGSICCYFIITYCLFFTPKWAKKNKALLVLHRSASLLPVIYIITAWVLYRGNGIWFNLKWPREVLFLFNGERLPFSILAISYLFGYYFIRLYYEKKLGVVNANVFFNSNRFIWLKNILLSLIILIVSIFELYFRNNAIANKLDFGFYWQIIFLIPVVLFYHPHKGPRKTALDLATTALYLLALFIAYTLVAGVVILGLLANMV